MVNGKSLIPTNGTLTVIVLTLVVMLFAMEKGCALFGKVYTSETRGYPISFEIQGNKCQVKIIVDADGNPVIYFETDNIRTE